MHKSLLLPALLLASLPGQDLHRAILGADVVVVGRQVGKTAFDPELTLHRVQIVADIHGGDGHKAVTVLDWPNLALHQRPTPRQTRLYCLKDASVTATRLGLPAQDGPYYKMIGWAGGNPLVGADLERDPVVGFARVLAAAERGAPPAITAAAVCELALRGDPAVRTAAAKLLTERTDLRGHLSAIQWSQLASRAGGEVDDVPFKIALAELCAEQRLPDLLEALLLSVGTVQDPEYARAVGRIGAYLHGNDAAQRLLAQLQQTREPGHRERLLLALGATSTDTALTTLLQMKRAGADAAVDAALREHRSPRAQEAVAPRK